MGYCGLPEEGRRGENCQNDMAVGGQFTADSGNGGMGVFEMIFQTLSIDADFENISIDSTSCKVHQSANGGKKSGNKAVGMSRGGRNTKIHALMDGLGNPLAFLLSSGSDHDSIHAIPLLSQIDIKGSNILGDKAYGTKTIRAYIDSKKAAYTIPPKSNTNIPWPVD